MIIKKEKVYNKCMINISDHSIHICVYQITVLERNTVKKYRNTGKKYRNTINIILKQHIFCVIYIVLARLQLLKTYS